MAQRHQFLQCYMYLNENYLSEGQTKFTKIANKTPICNSSEQIQNAILTIVTNVNQITLFNFVEHNDIEYQPNHVVIIDNIRELQFGEIINVTSLDGTIYFILQELETINYCAHYNCYFLQKKIVLNLLV